MEKWKSQKQIDNEKDELIKELKNTITELNQALQLQQGGVSGSFDKLIDDFKLETNLVWHKNPNTFKEWANDR